MIKKDVLIEKIKDLILMEEEIIPLLKDHINSSLNFSSFEKSKINSIQAAIDKAAQMENKHINFLKQIINDLNDRKDNVF